MDGTDTQMLNKLFLFRGRRRLAKRTDSCLRLTSSCFSSIVRPRALKEPVGLADSSLIQSFFNPKREASRLARMSGVNPSPRLTMSSAFLAGSSSWYRHIEAERRHNASRREAPWMRSKSYFTNSGKPHSQRFTNSPAEWALWQELTF